MFWYIYIIPPNIDIANIPITTLKLLSPDLGKFSLTFGTTVPLLFPEPLLPFIPVSPIPLPGWLLLLVPGTLLLLNILVELLFGSPVNTLPLYIYWLVVPPELFPFAPLFPELLAFEFELLFPFGWYLPLLFPELFPELLFYTIFVDICFD